MSVTITNTMDGKNYSEALEAAVIRGLTKIAINVEGDAISLVPVDSGRLKGSITYAVKGGESNTRSPAKPGDGVSSPTDEMTAHVGTNVEYAQHVEYGTVKMSAQPFLRPALNQNRKSGNRIMQTEIREGLKRGS